MNNDPFNSAADSLIAPARLAFAVEPDDQASFAIAPKALYVGTGGDITLRTVAGTADVTFRNVPSGSVLAIRTSAVRQTGTTADHLIGLA